MLDLAALEQYVITLPSGGRDTSGWPKATAWPGVEEEAPAWYPLVAGHWGCQQAHLNLWKHLEGATAPVLILEDDAELVAPLGVVSVPDDWEMLKLGGQHRIPPRETGHLGVVRCRETLRTHAYVLRDGASERVTAAVSQHSSNSMDLQLAAAMRLGQLHVYGVKPWRVAQAAGMSLINQRLLPQQTWER